jgi:hypothetical protein
MFSVDWASLTTSIFTYASIVVSALLPLVGISAGFSLGFGLVNKIGNMFAHAI